MVRNYQSLKEEFEIKEDANMYLVEPITQTAQEWVKENVPLEPWQMYGPSFVVDHHFIDDLFDGMIEDGLIPKQDFTIQHV